AETGSWRTRSTSSSNRSSRCSVNPRRSRATSREVTVKKLINDVGTVLPESLAGLLEAHSDILAPGEANRFIRRARLKPGKVALVSGGGSGHEPLHAGFVGHGMLDAACPGEVFTSPTPDQILAAAEAVDTGGGVLFVVKNYEGDVMNFEMAAEMSSRD